MEENYNIILIQCHVRRIIAIKRVSMEFYFILETQCLIRQFLAKKRVENMNKKRTYITLMQSHFWPDNFRQYLAKKKVKRYYLK